jgi:formylglycine-generating enzyme required for sulfatase activity
MSQTAKEIILPNTAITIPLVWVEGGSFWMGGEMYDWEKPMHQVRLDGFWLGKYPVTQAQWQAVVAEASRQNIPHELNPEPAYFKSPQRPVEQVSWLDCVAWLDLLNQILPNSPLGLGAFTLPTEAQWEYAARGGIHQLSSEAGGFTYAGSDNLHEVAWYDDNSHQQTKVVGLKKPNQLGIYDLSGNVWEWCLDEYDEKAYEKTPENFKNPFGIDGQIVNGSNTIINKNRANPCVLRGGSWGISGIICRVALRDHFNPDIRDRNDGFRVLSGFL